MLLSISPQNKHTFEAIHQSLFIVCLDYWPAPSVPADQRDENLRLTFDIDQHTPNSSLSQSSRSLSAVPSDLLSHQYAIRSSPSALNRFFDKPLSLIVEPSTRAGAIGEHSPVDALIPSVVCEWAVAGANGVNICGGLASIPFENVHQEDKLEGLEVGSGSRWTRLNFVSSPSIQIAIENAKQHARSLISNSDHEVSYFEEWGGEEMQRMCEFFPSSASFDQTYSLCHQQHRIMLMHLSSSRSSLHTFESISAHPRYTKQHSPEHSSTGVLRQFVHLRRRVTLLRGHMQGGRGEVWARRGAK